MTERDGSLCLSIQKVSHQFKAVRALTDVTFDVRRGEALGLLGPNGSGKSTLLGLLTGQLRLRAGMIEYCGASLTTRRGRLAMASALGVVFQSPALDPQLSATENLQLAGRMVGLRGEELASAVSRGLGRARLVERSSERVKTLSGGMRRRLDLARALLHEPEVLLMDEPTVGLDESSYAAFWALVANERQRRGLTVLVATHRADEAARCDRVAVFRAGAVVALDTPSGLQAGLEPDVLEIETGDPTAAADAVIALDDSLKPQVTGSSVRVECRGGHGLIPRLVEALPAGVVRSVSLHRTSLADVFLHITGETLAGDEIGGDEVTGG